MSTPMTTSAGSMHVTSTGPSGATGTFTVPATGSFGLAISPTGPTFASFAGAGSFGGAAGPTGEMGHWIEFHGVAHIEAQAEAVPQHTGVPRLAELILCIFIRPEHQKEQLARYEERFNDWSRKFDTRTARRFYWFHAIRSIFDMLKIGVIGALIDWIWDHLFGGKP